MTLRRLLALLLLTAFVIGLSEDLLLRADAYALHVVCPEHGELIHAAVGSESPDPSVRAQPGEHHGLSCELAALGAVPPAVQPPAPQLTDAAVEPPALPPAPLIDQDVVIALVLGYAPKTSPPIA